MARYSLKGDLTIRLVLSGAYFLPSSQRFFPETIEMKFKLEIIASIILLSTICQLKIKVNQYPNVEPYPRINGYFILKIKFSTTLLFCSFVQLVTQSLSISLKTVVVAHLPLLTAELVTAAESSPCHCLSFDKSYSN